jgi:hypothetical protein
MDPVQEQLDAYNARDIERFVACYTDDVVVEDGARNVQLRGRNALRQRYERPFSDRPEQRCQIVNRIRISEYVIDEELIAGTGRDDFHIVAIYRLVGQQIAHVRFLEDSPKRRQRFWRRS